MNKEETVNSKDQSLRRYKAIEAKLYGELTKACRRYSNELSLISILGILEIVEQELKELEKMKRQMMKRKTPKPEERENLDVIF